MNLAEGVSSRRNVFKGIGAAVVAGATGAMNPGNANAYSVPDLPYAFDALEPHIDAPTMKIHHDKHHGTYVANINKATEGKPEVPILDLQESAIEAGAAFRNSGGGHYNHAFFWEEMAPPGEAAKTKPSKQLEDMINKSFGSMDEMKAQFEARAAPGALFGSGWVWITVNQKGDELKLVGTPNQDNPLMKGALDEISYPILGLDGEFKNLIEKQPKNTLLYFRPSLILSWLVGQFPLTNINRLVGCLPSIFHCCARRYQSGNMLITSSTRTVDRNMYQTGGMYSSGWLIRNEYFNDPFMRNTSNNTLCCRTWHPSYRYF